ncbi:MAG: glyoxalase-like domain protein [Pseudanabaena sp. RU_4_16]|nr:glyoxalase-like domain protein [Pseudanabaena sp. RU_4_16]
MDFLFSTQGVMILLLGAYAAAMWMFLTSAPKVHTVMVSDMDQAKVFYEGQLQLPNADVPLHYYYGYDQGLGATVDPMYLPREARSTRTKSQYATEGLWYQLQKNAQLHIVPGAKTIDFKRSRHVCFNRDCVEKVLLRIQTRGIKHKIVSENPLQFLVKDPDGRVIAIEEIVG